MEQEERIEYSNNYKKAPSAQKRKYNNNFGTKLMKKSEAEL